MTSTQRCGEKLIILRLVAGLIIFLGFGSADFARATCHPWTPSGPNGGTVRCILATSQFLCVGTPGGIFRSPVGGDSWSLTFAGQGILSFAADPGNSTVIYAGTENGVCKSTDSGLTWLTSSSGLGSPTVRALVVKTEHPACVLAGTDAGIYRSTDGGSSWTLSNTGFAPASITSFARARTALFAGTSSGIYKSTDSGISWTPADSGLTNQDVRAVASTADSSILYAGTAAGVFRSADSGASWTAVNTGFSNTDIRSIAVAADSSSSVFAVTASGLYHTTSSGSAWSAANSGLENKMITAVAPDPRSAVTFFAGTRYQGLYRTLNDGSSWHMVNNGLGAVTGFDLYTTNPSNLLAATECGIYSSTDGGSTWTARWLSNRKLTAFVKSSNMLLAGSFGTILRSVDNGSTWTATLIPAADVNDLAVAGSTFFACTDEGLFKSTDGLAWTLVNPVPSSSLSCDPSQPNILWLGTGDGVLWSQDGGVVWYRKGLDGCQVTGIIVTGLNTAYACTRESGVFRTMNGGSTWLPTNTGLSGTDAVGMVQDSSGSFFVAVCGNDGSPGGIYRSSDGPLTWSKLDTGLNSDRLLSLGVISGPMDQLSTAVYGCGIWTLSLDTTPPSTPTVFDDGTTTFFTDRLSGSWYAEDPESGIMDYEWAIGTVPGGSNVGIWRSTNGETSSTRTGLTLNQETTCYISARARNGDGLYGPVGSSDGIIVRALTPRWAFATGAPVVSSPSAYESSVYVGNDAGRLFCLDAEWGDVLWTFDTRLHGAGPAAAIKSRPAVYEDRIYVTTNDGCLFCLNLSGSLVWHVQAGTAPASTPAPGHGSVTVACGGLVKSFSALTGELLAVSVSLGADILSSPSVPDADMIWVSDGQGNLNCLHKSLQIIRATVPVGGNQNRSSPWVDVSNGRLFIGSTAGSIRCLDAVSFGNIWGPTSVNGEIQSSPWVNENAVYFGTELGYLYALNPVSGSNRWSFAASGALRSSPVAVDGWVFIGSQDGVFYAVKEANGADHYGYSGSGAFESSPAASNPSPDVHLVFIGCTDGTVYAFDRPQQGGGH